MKETTKFEPHSQNLRGEKKSIIFVMSLCTSVRMEQLGSPGRIFTKFLIFLKSV